VRTQYGRRRGGSRIGQTLFALIVLLWGAQALSSTPGSPAVRFETVSLEQGLSQATVQAILQDHRGFLWFGTQEGLNRYDGYTFDVFTRDPDDASSLANDWIWTLHEDADGNLWVGTNGGGLSRYDRETGGFTNFPVEVSDAGGTSANHVRAIHASDPGTLWVGTDGGLRILKPRTATFTRFRTPDESDDSSDDRVRSIRADGEGLLWVSTDGGGLLRIDPESGEAKRFRHDPENPSSLGSDRVRCVFEDRRGVLWVGLYDGGLDQFDRRDQSFTHFGYDPDDPASLPDDRVRDLLEDSAGDLWIATDGGLVHRSAETGRFSIFRHSAIDLSSLADDRTRSLLQDRGGVIWVGTYGGASKWNPLSSAFSHYRDDERSPGRLHGNVVNAFAEDPDGSLWVATYAVGLNRFDVKSGTFELYAHDPDRPGSLSDNRVMSLMVERSGALWVGTMTRGLDRFDRARGTFTNHRHDPEDPRTLSANGVTTIFEDSTGTIWVGTYRGGLNRWDGRSGGFVRYVHDPRDPGSLSDDRVLAIYEDRNGVLWIGTEGGGINRFDRRTESFTSFRHDPSDPESLSDDTAWAIHEDSQRVLWIGTQGGGLSRWDPENRDADRGVFRRYTQKDGLASMSVYGILGDEQGNFWLSSNRGLSRFDPRTGVFRHFDTSHGLQSHEFNFGAYFRGKDGRLYFGGVNGFNAFDPARVIDNPHVPPVVLTDFRRADTEAEEIRISEVEEIELTHRDYFVAFGFAALDYTAPEHNRYMYRLEGFDDDWIDIGTSRRATYTNLAPGAYTFRVRASNNDDVWNETGAALRVRVHPPPWKTWWAYTLMACAVLGAAGTYVRSQKLRLEREAASTRAAEAASRAKSEFLATMSHEIRTPMNGLLGTTEVLLQMELPQKQSRLAESAHRSARGLLDTMNDVLDFSTIEAGKLRLDVVDVNLRDLLKEVVELHTEEAAAKSVDIMLYLPDALPGTLRGDPVRLRQILSNLVGNAVKFTQRGEVTVRVTSGQHSTGSIDLRFEVRDTGIGISSDRLDRVFGVFSQADSSMTREYSGTGLGLAISRRLVELMGGEIGVESESGVGSTFWFTCELEIGTADASASAEKADPAGLRALIVTDDTATLQILRHHLAGWKVDHLSASSAAEALDVVKSEAVSPKGLDLVLVDDSLEGEQAPSLARRIHGQVSSGQIEVVVLSAVGKSDRVNEVAGAGIHSYLTKPILAPRLRACLESVAGLIPRLASSEAPADAPVGGRVLFVEDSVVNQEVCQAMLESAGLHVDLASNGSEGVELATSRHYDAILMDLQMPGMDGFEATRRIRDHERSKHDSNRRVRIIALSANATSDDREKSFAAGMDDFVSKPFSQEQLLDALRRGLPADGPTSGLDHNVADGVADEPAEVEVEDVVPNAEAMDYEALIHRCMGKQDLAHRLIGKFVDCLDDDVALIGSLLDAQDWEEAAQAAHKVKGAAAALEATELRACLEDLERNLRRGVSVDVDLVTTELARTSGDYHKAAKQILDSSREAVAGDVDANSRR
jgi:signal transduction histidine kinase/ligand-binding sensor domain-containing protein/DNA-binding response OmpR family regulator/HPt (histidine-containing phosphotransfer) domain-containing protein